MKRKILNNIVLILSIISLILTGCGKQPSETEEPVALVLVLGNHANFPALSSNVGPVYEMIYEACITYGNVSVVVVDGAPSIRGDYRILPVDKALTKSKEKAIATQNANTIVAECINARAISPEVDTLTAIKLGANALNSVDIKSKVMYIYDSGLSTHGLISQVENDVLSTDSSLVIKSLEAVHAIPDLTGIDVQWVGLGTTAGEQERMPDSYQYKLKTFWETLIEAAGGTVEFDCNPISGEEGHDLPKVTAVSFVQDSLDIDFLAAEVLDKPVVFNEKTVKFLGNKAEFADKEAAMEALKPVAQMLADNPDLCIRIIGTTATAGTETGCRKLSMERAEACKTVLIESGASEEQMECIGLGKENNRFRVNDLNEDGSLNEEMAALNRAIYIIPSDFDMGIKKEEMTVY